MPSWDWLTFPARRHMANPRTPRSSSGRIARHSIARLQRAKRALQSQVSAIVTLRRTCGFATGASLTQEHLVLRSSPRKITPHVKGNAATQVIPTWTVPTRLSHVPRSESLFPKPRFAAENFVKIALKNRPETKSQRPRLFWCEDVSSGRMRVRAPRGNQFCLGDLAGPMVRLGRSVQF